MNHLCQPPLLSFYPENSLSYMERGLTLINEALKIQPLYTRYWTFMGSSETFLASQEKDAAAKNNLINNHASTTRTIIFPKDTADFVKIFIKIKTQLI